MTRTRKPVTIDRNLPIQRFVNTADWLISGHGTPAQIANLCIAATAAHVVPAAVIERVFREACEAEARGDL